MSQNNPRKTTETESAHPGLAMTLSIGGDDYPCTVRRVSGSGQTLWFSQDDAKGGGIFALNDRAEEQKAYWSAANARWMVSKKPYYFITLGQRSAKWDPHF